MNHAIHVEHPACATQPPKPQPVRSRPLQPEQTIESRIRRLGDEIRDLVEAPYPGLLQDRDSIREALEELTASIVLLDPTLAQYGPEANTARNLLPLALKTLAVGTFRIGIQQSQIGDCS